MIFFLGGGVLKRVVDKGPMIETGPFWAFLRRPFGVP